jgi:hypothetical protein
MKEDPELLEACEQYILHPANETSAEPVSLYLKTGMSGASLQNRI